MAIWAIVLFVLKLAVETEKIYGIAITDSEMMIKSKLFLVDTVVVSILGSRFTANSLHHHFLSPNHLNHLNHRLPCRIILPP